MTDIKEIINLLNELGSSDMLSQLAQFFIWVFFILFFTWLVRKAINRTLKDNTMRYRARKVTRLASYLLIILLAIISFTGQVQYFTIAIGLISAGLAFALQEVILSVAGWIAIYSSDIFKPGDRIEINNVKGDVIDIGITKTTLMEIGQWVQSNNYSGRIVQVSNAFVFKGEVYNYSTDFPFVWDEINLPIRYGSDIKLANQFIKETTNEILTEYSEYAKENWKEMVKKYLIEDANVDPTLTMKLTDNWVEFNLRFVVDYKKNRSTKDLLFKSISDKIENSNGKVVLASATHEIVGLPNIKVDISSDNRS